MSLYGEYIKERLGAGIVERPEGFATFRVIDDGGVPAVYIQDIYVKPSFRKDGIAAQMADDIAKLGRGRGCKIMIGTVQPSAKGSTDSLKVLIGYGMSLHSSGVDAIIFKKEI